MQILQTLMILNKSFNYKVKLLGNTKAQADNPANEILKSATITVPLKHLSNFWRSLEMPLINWKVELKLKQSIVFYLYPVLIMLIVIMMIIILFLLYFYYIFKNHMFLL